VKTVNSFTFQARYYVEPYMERHNSIESDFTGNWIVSSGRWDSHAAAVNVAAAWLIEQANEGPQQYQIAIIQVEELELLL
jgi:hypothetical protein